MEEEKNREKEHNSLDGDRRRGSERVRDKETETNREKTSETGTGAGG